MTCMLTKRFSPEQLGSVTGSIQPMSWRRTGNQSVAPQAVLKKTGTPEEQIAFLQARLAEMERLLERQVQEARAAAYREGEQTGQNQAAARIQPVLDKLARSIHEVAELKPRLRRDAEADLLKLSLAISRKILNRELSIDPDSIAGLIKVSIEKIRAQEIVRVRVHPQHQQVVQQILAKMPVSTRVEILPDTKLELGGVVIETSRGDFNASVDLQLKEIERGLTDRLAGHR